MSNNKKRTSVISEKEVKHRKNHLTTPPRMEGKVKNAKINPVRKKKKLGSV